MIPTFSICHATARPNGWQESYRSCIDNVASMGDASEKKFILENEVEYVLSYDLRWGDFHPEFFVDYPKIAVALDVSEPKNSVANWNNAAKHSTGDILILMADDFRYPKNWDLELLKVLFDAGKTPDDEFVIHVNTGCPDKTREDKLMALGIMSRAVYKRWGYALYPEYESMSSDVDFTEHAYYDGIVIEARHLLFQHRHREWGMSPDDAVYQHQNRLAAYYLGDKILARRRLDNFSK